MNSMVMQRVHVKLEAHREESSLPLEECNIILQQSLKYHGRNWAQICDIFYSKALLYRWTAVY